MGHYHYYSSHSHHHHSHGGNGFAGLVGILLLVVLGFSAWGCVALGAALGLAAVAGFFAGGGIIVGGVIAAAAAGFGIYKLVEFCKRKYHKSKSARPVITEKASVVASTRDIGDYFAPGFGSNNNSLTTDVPMPPVYQQPQEVTPVAPVEDDSQVVRYRKT